MKEARVVMTLAGVSLLAPAASAIEPARVDFFPTDPSSGPTDYVIKIDARTFTYSGGSLAKRSDVRVSRNGNAYYYGLQLLLDVAPGAKAYAPTVSFSGVSASALKRALKEVRIWSPAGSGEFGAYNLTLKNQCFSSGFSDNINWRPKARTAKVEVLLLGRDVDAALAKAGASFTMQVSVNSVSTCDNSDDSK